MKQMFKVALMCAATVGSVFATSCSKGGGENPPAEEEYTIRISANPGAGGKAEAFLGTIAAEKAREGDVVTIVATASGEQYVFTGWEGNVDVENVSTETTTFTMPAENVTVTANFGEVDKTYALNFEATSTGGTVEVTVDGAIIATGKQVDVGTEVTVKASAAENFGFTGWDGVTLTNPKAEVVTFKMPAEDVTLTASFIATYAIRIDDTPNGSILVKVGEKVIADGDQVAAGETVSVEATEEAECVFVGWDVTGVTLGDTTSESFVMPESEVTLGATFEKIEWIQIGGAKWAKKNVAAPNMLAAKVSDYGYYYQHGKLVGWNGATPTPAGGLFYLLMTGWGTSAANADNKPYGQGPCPTGYTVPTQEQYQALWSATTAARATVDGVLGMMFTEGDATLFFPYAGYNASGQQPSESNGIQKAGREGCYWLSPVLSFTPGRGVPSAYACITASQTTSYAGTVIEAYKSVGDLVRSGDVLMKFEMSSDQTGSDTGVVAEVKVAVGDVVAQNDVLMTVDAKTNLTLWNAGTVVDVKVGVGDVVQSGDVLMTVEAKTEQTSWNSGTVVDVKVGVGDVVQPGDVLMTLDNAGTTYQETAQSAGTVRSILSVGETVEAYSTVVATLVETQEVTTQYAGKVSSILGAGDTFEAYAVVATLVETKEVTAQYAGKVTRILSAGDAVEAYSTVVVTLLRTVDVTSSYGGIVAEIKDPGPVAANDLLVTFDFVIQSRTRANLHSVRCVMVE